MALSLPVQFSLRQCYVNFVLILPVHSSFSHLSEPAGAAQVPLLTPQPGYSLMEVIRSHHRVCLICLAPVRGHCFPLPGIQCLENHCIACLFLVSFKHQSKLVSVSSSGPEMKTLFSYLLFFSLFIKIGSLRIAQAVLEPSKCRKCTTMSYSVFLKKKNLQSLIEQFMLKTY